MLTATCASCIVQDVKSTTELVAQDRLYLDEGTPDCGNFKVLNILKEYTHEEQKIIVAFDALTFTCLPELVGKLNKLREVSATAAVKPGFYEQQMQRAVEDALAAANQQELAAAGSSSHAAGAQQHACGAVAGHGCGHRHHDQPPSDPLEPNNPLERHTPRGPHQMFKIMMYMWPC